MTKQKIMKIASWVFFVLTIVCATLLISVWAEFPSAVSIAFSILSAIVFLVSVVGLSYTKVNPSTIVTAVLLAVSIVATRILYSYNMLGYLMIITTIYLGVCFGLSFKWDWKRVYSWGGLVLATVLAVVMTKGYHLWHIAPVVVFIASVISLLLLKECSGIVGGAIALAILLVCRIVIPYYYWLNCIFNCLIIAVVCYLLSHKWGFRRTLPWGGIVFATALAIMLIGGVHWLWLIVPVVIFIVSLCFLGLTGKVNVWLIIMAIVTFISFVIPLRWFGLILIGLAVGIMIWLLVVSFTKKALWWIISLAILFVAIRIVNPFIYTITPVPPVVDTTFPAITETATPDVTSDTIVSPGTTVVPDTTVTPNVTPDTTVTPDVTPDVHKHCFQRTVVEPTCTEEGYTMYACCCGEQYKEAVVKEKGHSYVAKITKQATCTAEGTRTYTCNCGKSYTETIAKIAHTYTSKVVEPTITEKGYTLHTCSMCGKAYKDNYTDKLPAPHTHSYVSKVTKQATCTAEGTRTYTCNCGKSYTETIAKIAHKYTSKVVEPTTTAKGYTLHTCTMCGKSYKDNYTDKLPAPHVHKYDIVTVLKPTVNHQGYTQYTCSCGDFYRDNYTNVKIAVSTDYMVKGDTVIVTLTNAEATDVVIKYVHPDTAEWVIGGATLKAIGNSQYRLIVDETMWTIGPDLAIGLKDSNEYLVVTLEPWFD